MPEAYLPFGGDGKRGLPGSPLRSGYRVMGRGPKLAS